MQLVEIQVDAFLNRDRSTQSALLATIGKLCPTAVSQLVEEVVQRVAAGAITGNSLGVFGYGVLFAVDTAFQTARRSSQQYRLLRAVIQIAPTFDHDELLAFTIHENWDRNALEPYVMKTVSLVRDEVLRLLVG